MPSAIVTGATGILGRAIVFALGKDPKTWQTVHALSRKKTEEYPSNVRHDKVDLLGSPEQIAGQLQNVEAEYVFFAAYLEKSDDKEASDVNGAMLSNFLDALALTGAEKKLKRVILTTGAKQYGLHLGPVKQPMEESDPWITGPNRPVNFYYTQQDILKKKAAEGKSWDWAVTYPNDVIGVAHGNFMNLSTSIGLYAAITKELQQPFIFPGSLRCYTGFDCFSGSKLHAEFNLWAALEPKCSNQAFNIFNGDVQSWQNLWPKLARKFGLEIPEDQFTSKDDKIVDLAEVPPLADHAKAMGIQHHVSRGKLISHVDLVAWSQRAEVKDAWHRLADRHGLHKDALGQATWAFVNFILGRNYDVVIDMTKARRSGWNGWADTWEVLEESLDGLAKDRVLPKM